MRVVTDKDFRERTEEILESRDLLLATRDGQPAGLYVPWDVPDLPDDQELFLRLSEANRREFDAKGITEEEILRDFAVLRGPR